MPPKKQCRSGVSDTPRTPAVCEGSLKATGKSTLVEGLSSLSPLPLIRSFARLTPVSDDAKLVRDEDVSRAVEALYDALDQLVALISEAGDRMSADVSDSDADSGSALDGADSDAEPPVV